jgi:hypothetical protein
LVVTDGEEETRAGWSYIIDRTFEKIYDMVVDNDDNLILADQSFLRMYSKDGKSVKECKLYIVVSVMDVPYIPKITNTTNTTNVLSV